MRSANLGVGDRFAYLSKNSIDFVIMYFAASKVGAVPVPLNYRLAPREWLYIIDDAGAQLVFAQSEFTAGLDTVASKMEKVRLKVVLDDAEVAGWSQFEEWIGSQPTKNLGLDIKETDLLYQMYTSGTTGLPKGAMLSQRAIDCNLTMVSTFIPSGLGDSRVLIVAPMYHAAAGISLMAGVSRASTLVIHREFVPADVVHCLAEKNIAIATLVPAMIQACLVAVPDIKSQSFPNLKYLLYGASPIAEETLREAIEVFACDFFQGFGMTETSALATCLSPADHARALAGEPGLLLSAGRPALGTEVKICDEDDQELPRGQVGEIAIKGPQVMEGYWHLEEATEKALKNGWMHTGDAAYMDEEGYIFIQDRIKDMVVCGGENVYPREVENALFEHSAVADAAVIGIPSEQWGEAIMAFLVLRDGESVTSDEMIEFCRERLAGFKIPRKIEVLKEIPRNTSGKVLKKDLREPYWKGQERRVR
jgi:acyl-CoA synthetase (AMP-forming)/AMP-acid ligase II